ncbi:endonuclease III [Candidatus Micrarchaeota archaeon CG08_land_8_20_14_0_20_49_17]|nr:MAG: endonuclease III [Candidatus Micrarchaeota archaeon CG1_02_49_24]PIU09452.1 MAG: endonuclease III [Candidatus Micrarchaeota archaeon CG08_land_8_20_14_0_20_49_17]PIU81222.1 MAG: endonuclease III [Candidatus Micrarchaeota archaeon CG06_land_8_20_14_3_00_50_6]PIZ94182.1 MAG: endonuclease III [Candidatus Micrarchaeota archaeon CG_4_10_14_0_2_um_filter_49_7]HII54107.1 endonuclease III [Candidatus Micrarchaeota archaeon]
MPTASKRINKILQILEREYPYEGSFLKHRNPFQLLVATILSAQCTDKRVNKVTPALFKKYGTPSDFANTTPTELEQMVFSTGFYHAKAKNITASCKKIVNEFGGKVPNTMEALLSLPGVGRKTANIILYKGFGKNEGIAVDTHVIRLSNLIGLVKTKNQGKIERELMAIVPKGYWDKLTELFIRHGRNVCIARRPKCGKCAIRQYCDYGLAQ